MKKYLIIFGLIFFWSVTLGFNEGVLTPDESKISNISHDGKPDSLTNKLDTPIFVEIRDGKGDVSNALLTPGGGPGTRVLPPNSTREIDPDVFRTGESVELIITIPGKRRRSNGGWDIQQAIWNLGSNPADYTEINYLGRQQGYQLIFVYSAGLQPYTDDEQNIVDEPDGLLTHTNGHICKPGDICW